MNSWQEDVLEFHKTFGAYISSQPSVPAVNVVNLRITLIKEEVKELLDALEDSELEEIADGIVDVIVVCLGTAISCGIDISPVWDEVHKSNMAKTGGTKRLDGKILKPENWTPSDISKILKAQGEKQEERLRQVCQDCRWFYRGKEAKPSACYLNGKWTKWLKKGSEDKPSACGVFEK